LTQQSAGGAHELSLKPGDAIGILGGGQLGRMLALAAARLGFRCHVLAPEAGSPAFDVCARRFEAAYDDEQALRSFAASVACVTYEFENVPARAIEIVAGRTPVRPGAKALAVCQDRLKEKHLARELGAPTAAFAPVDSLEDLRRCLAEMGTPSILKTRRFGYDGKGQAVLRSATEAEAAWAAVKGAPSILEGFVAFRCEISVVAARALDGTLRAFPVAENEHRDQILHRSVAPASVHPNTARSAIEMAARIGAALDYVGVFAVEFFVSGEGLDETLYVNEIAPRVHNSGHWTDGGADTSQFEQHIRAIAGLPLGSAALRAPSVEMTNLIGADVERWREILATPGAQLQLYGKDDARPGRKMGHVTRLIYG